MFYFPQAMESSLLYAIGFTGNVRDELSHGERDLRGAGAGAAPGPRHSMAAQLALWLHSSVAQGSMACGEDSTVIVRISTVTAPGSQECSRQS